MYPEFIAIYVMLAVIILMLGLALLLLILLLVKTKKNNTAPAPVQSSSNPYYGQQYQNQAQYPQAGSIVFCRHCATQFDSSQAYCPQCGTRR